ncbi:hypothetical protein [Glycomyces sp. NPDC021274]|uniref:hypothetical protein n=1 Tax=Glycomyces sp. NPDC021274 TaxID=3155120 RepID=UPI00340D0AF9
MAISVRVRTNTGETEGTSTHKALNALCELASTKKLSLLGCVDPYDDTTFNRAQLKLLIPELEALAEDSNGDVADAARELLALTALVDRKPHRYLIFIGD